jgi:structure-specific recognition protein 1
VATRQFFGKTLEKHELSVKGWNWGDYEFDGSQLKFLVANREAFRLPLKDVAGATVASKEVVLELKEGIDHAVFGPENLPVKRRKRDDEMCEIRFYVPGNAKINQEGELIGSTEERFANDDQVEVKDDDQIAKDDAGNYISAADLFCDTIKDRADLGGAAGESIAIFPDLLCLTPRYVYRFPFARFANEGKVVDLTFTFTEVSCAFTEKPTTTAFRTTQLRSFFSCANQMIPIGSLSSTSIQRCDRETLVIPF